MVRCSHPDKLFYRLVLRTNKPSQAENFFGNGVWKPWQGAIPNNCTRVNWSVFGGLVSRFHRPYRPFSSTMFMSWLVKPFNSSSPKKTVNLSLPKGFAGFLSTNVLWIYSLCYTLILNKWNFARARLNKRPNVQNHPTKTYRKHNIQQMLLQL